VLFSCVLLDRVFRESLVVSQNPSPFGGVLAFFNFGAPTLYSIFGMFFLI